jgi:PAS domain S-box-containing protein
MNNPASPERKWDESTSANTGSPGQTRPVFDSFFERSVDAMWLVDPANAVIVDCNRAAVQLMGASDKTQLLQLKPEDLSPPAQPCGVSSRARTAQITALVEQQEGYRFEWTVQRLDGRLVPLEVSATPIVMDGRKMHIVISRDITERKMAEANLRESEERFRKLFEASTDAISILDPQTRKNIACNAATVKMAHGGGEEWFLSQPIDSLAPERQPDGRLSREVAQIWIDRAMTCGPQRFDWVARRFTGEEFPVEILLTPLRLDGRQLLVTVSRDISERKRVEQELLELNQSLERRVAERTAELTNSEARFRALVEHAPEAIVVFEAKTGRFLFGNQHACGLYGVPMERLTELTPVDVSPEFQACGRPSSELAREKMDEALAGGTPVFEWIHRQANGRLIPTEVRLLPLPAEHRNLIRASIIDNTERKRADQALRESEAKFRALFEGSSHGVVLHDENRLLEVNPAAVRILRRQSAEQLVGQDPRFMAPPFQPNGERSEVAGARFIEECMTKGSARFEWVAADPDGVAIPLEVALTRIEWSGRHVIQAFITDITERKQAERALHEANRELHREIEQRRRAEESLKEQVRMSSLYAEVAVALNAGTDLQPMLQRCCELMAQHLEVAFVRIWTLNDATQTLELQASAGCYTHLNGPHSTIKLGQYKIGLIAQEKKPLLTNSVQSDPRVSDKEWARKEGMVAFAGYPLLIEDRVLGVLALFARRPLAEDLLKTLGSIADSVALGIERKRAQTDLAESEARFSAAFQATPIFIAISKMSDGSYVLVNDALVNWSGYSREEILGRNSFELNIWENNADREAFWSDLRRTGSIRERECRLCNRAGKPFTMLMSSKVIQLNHVPHVLAMAVDITGRKKAEAELIASEARLRESEARFSVSFQASPVFISLLRQSDEKYVMANDALLNWLGCPREEVLGCTSAELNMWDNLPERDAVWRDLRTIGSVRQRECRWRNRRGELFTVLVSAETITIGNQPHVLSLVLDISQRKNAEVEILKALAREKELSQLKSNFVSMVSHEFRTPLGIIQSSAELLRDFIERMQPSEREEQLESITRNTRRMAAMMEEILVLSRLDAGKLEFQPSTLDLGVFCRRVVDEVLSATNRLCPIEFSLAFDQTHAHADERLLGHILTNLLMNGVKYSDAGAPVRFRVERHGIQALFLISDQGIGIPEKDQQLLFSAFHRGSNVGTRAGTGLGLLLVKRCVELHHGQVQIESQLGKGTTVTARLPVFEMGLDIAI